MTREQILALLKTGIIKQGVLAQKLYPERKRPDCLLSDKLTGRRGRYLTLTDINKITNFFKPFTND